MTTGDDVVAQLRALPAPQREAWFVSDDAVRLARQPQQYASVCERVRPAALPQLAQKLLARSPQLILLAQELVARGLSERPSSDAYVLGLMGLPWLLRDRTQIDALLDADPGLPVTLLRVFDIEGTADQSLASSDKYNHAPELMWGDILLSLLHRGATTRADLLTRTLGALANDWPQYRSGWHSRFHAHLAPAVDEMQPHLDRYLALCGSRIAPTVTLAVDALAQLDARHPIARPALFDALRPVFSGAVKAQVDAALKLVDRVVARDAAAAGDAALLAVDALLIEAAPLQKAVLKRLQAWGVDDAVRARLQALGDGIAAVNRPAWQALAGAPAAAPAPALAAAPATARAKPALPLDDDRRVPMPADDVALIDLIARMFEDDSDVDAFEAALAGIVQGTPFDATRRRALAPLLQRAPKVRKALSRLLARLLVDVLDERTLAWQGGIDPGGNASPVQAVLLQRVDALAAFAHQGGGLPPLATPTHRRGFIAPADLVQRVAAHQAAELESERLEQVLALLRLAPGAGDAERHAARQLGDSAFVRALRHALGDDVDLRGPADLFCAAARVRHPGADDDAVVRQHGDLGPDAARVARFSWQVHSWQNQVDTSTYHFHDLIVDTALRPRDASMERLAVWRHAADGQARQHFRWWSFGGWDAASITWSATLLPSDTEAFCAEGVRASGANLDWWEAQWHNAAYLRLLHDPTVRMGPMATLLLALALVGKEPGQTALAVDALVLAHADGRLDVALLGDTLRRLFATPCPKAARLVASLRAALRAVGALRGAVFALLADTVRADPAPREVAALLDLLLELQLSLGAPLPAATRSHLAAARWTGRARTLCRQLLAQDPHKEEP